MSGRQVRPETLKKLKGGMTAKETQQILESDPDWVAAHEREDRERQRRIAEYDRAAAPLKAELAEAGFEVESIADLYNQRMNYEAAIPILLDWFPRIEDRNVKESVARALTVRWARPEAAPMMVAELQRLGDAEEDRSLRFAAANALSEVADDSVFEEVVELARDPRYGWEERGVLAQALANMREQREQAIEVLRDLLADEEAVAINAVIALGDLRAEEARAEIEPFLEDDEAWVRREAEKALKKLDTARRRS